MKSGSKPFLVSFLFAFCLTVCAYTQNPISVSLSYRFDETMPYSQIFGNKLDIIIKNNTGVGYFIPELKPLYFYLRFMPFDSITSQYVYNEDFIRMIDGRFLDTIPFYNTFRLEQQEYPEQYLYEYDYDLDTIVEKMDIQGISH